MTTGLNDKQEQLERRLARERSARKEAERILEQKALELYEANEALRQVNTGLEAEIARRTSELQKQQRDYRNIVQSVADVIFSLNDSGQFTFMNQRGLNMLEVPLEEVQQMHYSDLVDPSYRERVQAFYNGAMARAETNTYLEFPIQTPSGKTFWLGQNTQIDYDGDRVVEVTSIARDITDRRIIEAKLKRSEEKYRGIIENMELGLMEVDNSGMILRAYEHFGQMVGWDPMELVGKNANDMFLPDEYRALMSKQSAIRLEGKQSVYEVEMIRKDQSRIWVLISGAPFYDETGKIIGSIGIHYDITERKQVERDLARAKDEAIRAKEAEKDFLARMSHEIRTPMNAIIGMSHMLRDSALDDEQGELVRSVLHSANLLRGLINSVLDLSKIEAGKVEVNLRPFNLLELAQAIHQTFQFRLNASPVEVHMEWDDRLPRYIISDELAINQVLMNLLGNAAKFTSEGSVAVRFANAGRDGNKVNLQLEVIDTGIGMTEAQCARIFESFSQADKDISLKYGGTGLGLAITKELIELLHGSIRVTSQPGVGTTFTVELQVEESVQNTGISEQSGESEDLRGKRILIAEDNPMNVNYIQRLMKRWGIDFVIARDGQEAVNCAQQERFDLILMDIQMPVMDGYQATEAIKQNPASPNHETPIVGLSAQAFQEDIERTKALGMSGYLTKPYTPDQLQAELQDRLAFDTEEEAEETATTFAFNERLDAAFLDAFYGGDLEYSCDMFTEFLRSTPHHLHDFEAVHGTDDAGQLRRWVHKIKPTLSMVGLTELGKEAECIELELSKVNADLSPELSSRTLKLYRSIESVLPMLNQEVARMTNALKS